MSIKGEWVRVTLRMSSELHDRIFEQAGSASMNAEIVTRLERSLANASREPSTFHYLDAVSPDVSARARVAARFQLAVAAEAAAQDVIILDSDIAARITAVTGEARKIHDAARAAIEAAFPLVGPTWREIVDGMRAAVAGEAAPAPLSAWLEALERRIETDAAFASRRPS